MLKWQTSKIRNIKVPFDSTLLPPAFVPHPLAHNSPKYVVVHVFPLFHCHICHDFGQSHFFVLCPWANGSVFRVFDVVPIAVPTIRCHSANSSTDFFPLLTELLHGPKEQSMMVCVTYQGNVYAFSSSSSECIHLPCARRGW